MEPVSIVMLTNGALGIARSLVHTIKELYELAEAYETAALGIRTVATQCNTFRVAIQRIHKWLTTQDESSRYNLDDDFWQALGDNLETGKLVLDDLEKRIAGLKKDSAKFWIRTKYLWNSVVISELQSQIQGLMSALSILIQVIDIPSTGGRRSQSLAQRSRLNNITKTVRLTVDQRRERIQQSQEQNLLDGVDDNSASSALQAPLPPSLLSSPPTTSQQLAARTSLGPRHDSTNDVSLRQADQPSMVDNAPPPPYDFYEKDQKETKNQSMPIMYDKKKPSDAVATEGENSSRPESKETKSKRSIWTMGFKKRSSTPKVDQISRSASDPRDSNSKDLAEPSTTSQILNPFDDSNSQMQHTPAAIEPSKEEQEYFGLQEAMVGVSIAPRSSGPMELPSIVPSFVSPAVEKDTDHIQHTLTRTISPPPLRKPVAEPSGYELLTRIASETKKPEPTSTTTQSYYPPPSTTNSITTPPTSPPTNPYASLSSKPATLDRIRPSQRVRETRERSRSREPRPAHPNTSTSSDRLPSRQLTPSPHPNPATSQTWRTSATSMSTSSNTSTSLSTSSATRYKITFSPTTYTSRISLPAAHSLHLLDHATTPLSTPIALLTLLYPVSDGTSQTVPIRRSRTRSNARG